MQKANTDPGLGRPVTADLPRWLGKRDRWVLGLGAVLACLLPLGRSTMARGILARAALRDPAPSQQALAVWWDTQLDKPEALETLWQTRLIRQRLFAMDQFRDLWQGGQGMKEYSDLIPFLGRAVLDGDFEVRCTAIELVAESGATLAKLLLPVLDDVDPQVRFAAARALKRCGTPAFTRHLIPLLDDPSSDVRIMAACGLRKWHGIDRGVRSNASANVNRAGLRAWREWADELASTLPNAPQPVIVPPPRPCHTIPIELSMLNGDLQLLSDLLGRPVLLHFWAAGERESHVMLPVLAELAGNHATDVEIIPVAVDCVKTEHVGGEHAHCHGHHHDHGETGHDNHECAHGAKRPNNPRKAIRSVCDDYDLHVPVCIDTGDAALCFVADELPTTVLIDAAGLVRRRFVGKRSSGTLRDMIHELPEQSRADTAASH